jgi:hypothetical protein
MSEPDKATSSSEAVVVEPTDGPVFEPYESPAGGWGAPEATARALREQSIALKGSGVLLSMNQPDGFDCPGCAIVVGSAALPWNTSTATGQPLLAQSRPKTICRRSRRPSRL